MSCLECHFISRENYHDINTYPNKNSIFCSVLLSLWLYLELCIDSYDIIDHVLQYWFTGIGNIASWPTSGELTMLGMGKIACCIKHIWHGNVYCIIGPLWGESIGRPHKDSYTFSLPFDWTNFEQSVKLPLILVAMKFVLSHGKRTK